MRIFRFATVVAAAALAAACATDRQTARITPPTPYVAMTETNPFGATHQDRSDGWTEIFVRLNESSSRERARDMAWYYAARLGATRQAMSIYAFAEESEVYCHVTQHRGPGVFVIGNPIAMVASAAFSAMSASTTVAETFDAYPIHLLLVSLSPSNQDAEGMVRVPVAETLAALKPEFEPDQTVPADASATNAQTAKAAGKKGGKERVTEANREQWVKNAEANVAVCMKRYERQKQMEKANRKSGQKQKDGDHHTKDTESPKEPGGQPNPDNASNADSGNSKVTDPADSSDSPQAEDASATER